MATTHKSRREPAVREFEPTLEMKYCPTCGQACQMHRHSMTENMAVILIMFAHHVDYRKYKPLNLREIPYGKAQWNNFQKLQYWNLVGQYDGAGQWVLHKKGLDFIEGRQKIKKWAITYLGETKEFEGDWITIMDVMDDPWRWREDYARDAIPVGDFK